MCGIVGMFTAENMGFYGADKDQFKNMLIVNSLRGSHSTGCFGVSKFKDKNDVSIVKSVGSPYTLFDFNKTNDFFSRMVTNFGLVVGHGRYATRGAIDAPNAHPFREGNITLVHNGVISNYFQLRDSKKHEGIEVDSQLIARLFAEEGAINVLPRIAGAYTFVWFDSDTGLLNIAKNDQRPLFFAEHSKKETLVFASEAETLDWHATRHKVEIDEITPCPNFRLLQYEKDSLECTVTPYKAKPIQTTWFKGNNNSWQSRQDSMYDDVKEEQSYQHYKQKRKQQPTIDKMDEYTVTITEQSHTMKVGEIVEFSVHDYEHKQGYTIIDGESDNFPNVEFYATGVDIIEEDLVDCSGIRGSISAIHLVPPDKTFNLTRWRVFITNFVMVFNNNGKEALVKVDSQHTNEDDIINSDSDIDSVLAEGYTIPAFDGPDVHMSQFRYVELASSGCGWCTGVLTKTDLSKPEHLMLHNDGVNESIVCPTCTQDYKTSLAVAAGMVH